MYRCLPSLSLAVFLCAASPAMAEGALTPAAAPGQDAHPNDGDHDQMSPFEKRVLANQQAEIQLLNAQIAKLDVIEGQLMQINRTATMASLKERAGR